MKNLLLPGLLAVSLGTSAQGMFGMYVKAYNPVGAFQQNVKTVPLGMAFDYFQHIKGSKFTVGAEVGMAMYTDFTYMGQVPTGQTVKLYEEDCFWTFHGEARYHFYQSPAVKTYVSARIGMTTFFSSIDSQDPKVTYDKFQTHGTAYNTGFGAGVMLDWNQIFRPGSESGHLYIDLGAGWHSGSNTSYRYVTRDQNIPLDKGKYNSLTNYVDYRIGILIGPRWL